MSLDAVASRLSNTGVKLECPQFKGHYFREWASKVQIVLQALAFGRRSSERPMIRSLGALQRGF